MDQKLYIPFIVLAVVIIAALHGCIGTKPDESTYSDTRCVGTLTTTGYDNHVKQGTRPRQYSIDTTVPYTDHEDMTITNLSLKCIADNVRTIYNKQTINDSIIKRPARNKVISKGNCTYYGNKDYPTDNGNISVAWNLTYTLS